MLWAMIRGSRGLRGGHQVARALLAQAVVEREVPLHRARIDPRRDRGQLVDDRLRAGPLDRAPARRRASSASATTASAPAARSASSFSGERVMPRHLVAVGEQIGRSGRPITPVAPARKILMRRRDAARRAGACIACWSAVTSCVQRALILRSPARLHASAHHPLAEAGRADREGGVEARAQVLQRDEVDELDQLAVVEVLAQRGEQLVVDLDGRARHRHRQVEHAALGLSKCGLSR